MSASVATVPAVPTVVDTPLNHTVRVEPMPDVMRDRSAMFFNARVAVTEYYNGALLQVVLTDNNDLRRLPLTAFADAYAAEVHAVVLPPIWPICAHCGQSDDEAHPMLGHDRLGAQRETGWRQPATDPVSDPIDDTLVVEYAR